MDWLCHVQTAQVATSPAWRSTRGTMWDGTARGGALGTVIINLQQTEQDG